MSAGDQNLEELRNTFHKAKRDLDAISRILEEELISKQDDGDISFYSLVQSVARLESSLSSFERDFYEIYTVKNDLASNAEILIQNWKTLEEMRGMSGLPKKNDEVIEPLQEVLQGMKLEFSSH